MEKNIKEASNTGMYMGDGEFYIGGKLYWVNPTTVRSVCYDDTPDKEKITLEFNHPDNTLEYYCLDGLQLDLNRIKRDFIKFWNTNAGDFGRFNVSRERWLAELKRRKENEIKFFEEQKRMKKEMIEKRKKDGESTQEEYERDLKWLEDKYAFLSNEEWRNQELGLDEKFEEVLVKKSRF